MNRDAALIRDIIEAMERIAKYLPGTPHEFAHDTKTQDAVLRNLEVIGEAAKSVSRALRDDHPEIRWKDMAGMRDKLIHDYAGVDLDIVWIAARVEVPKARGALEAILKALGP